MQIVQLVIFYLCLMLHICVQKFSEIRWKVFRWELNKAVYDNAWRLCLWTGPSSLNWTRGKALWISDHIGWWLDELPAKLTDRDRLDWTLTNAHSTGVDWGTSIISQSFRNGRPPDLSAAKTPSPVHANSSTVSMAQTTRSCLVSKWYFSRKRMISASS